MNSLGMTSVTQFVLLFPVQDPVPADLRGGGLRHLLAAPQHAQPPARPRLQGGHVWVSQGGVHDSCMTVFMSTYMHTHMAPWDCNPGMIGTYVSTGLCQRAY